MSKLNNYLPSAILTALFIIPTGVSAKIELPSFFSDHAVLQQNSNLIIKGKGKGEITVTPSWLDSPIVSKASADGVFTVSIPVPAAGGPFSLSFSDEDGNFNLSDLWAGEVWLCSGQSNMEMPLAGWGKVMDYKKEIANSYNPEIRLLQIKKDTALAPQENVTVKMDGWQIAAPATVADFSSIAYFFARQLAKELKVKIGVIDCTWGGTPAESWTSLEGVRSVPGFEKEIGMFESAGENPQTLQKIYDKKYANWLSICKKSEVRINPGKPLPDATSITLPELYETTRGIFDGVLWFQRIIDIPASEAGEPITLNLAMIDDDDITYFNGKEIGRGHGYNVLRSYTIPGNLVKNGRNIITIRVSDYGGGGGIWGNPETLNYISGDRTTSLAGEWDVSVGLDFSSIPPKPTAIKGPNFPTVLYNAMIYPLKDYPLKGTIWYQGCANVGRDTQYEPLFKRMIQDWRDLRNQPDMPFIFMQLAGFQPQVALQPDSEWAALRNAQTKALTLPATAMATAIDIGNPDDIHPKNKQEAARRLALQALNKVYGKEDIIADAPAPVSLNTIDNKGIITFDSDVAATSSRPTGFIVKLIDGSWNMPASAYIEDGTVILTSDMPIVEVRYNWADCPDGNLRGSSFLPVLPFSIKPENQKK